MKKLVVLSLGRLTGEDIVKQLKRFFQDTIDIHYYCKYDEFDFHPDDALAVLTGLEVLMIEKVEENIHAGMEYVVARRVINYKHIQEVISLPKGTEVLFVNDYESSTRLAIEQLKLFGLNHIHYSPYYPGIESYKPLDIAITPGEMQLVPEVVKRVINIGIRQLDITTIVELVQRLGLMEHLGDTISSQHMNEVIRLLKEVDVAAKHVMDMRDTLQTLADYSTNGILYTDIKGNIIIGNQALYQLLHVDSGDVINQNVSTVIPEIPQSVNTLEAKELFTIHGQDVFVWVQPVRKGHTTTGYIYTFEDSDTIQTLEHELRRKTRKVEHYARYTFHDIIYQSRQMEQLITFAKRLSQSDSTILIQGESGTGKELFAQAIHQASMRKKGPFVPVNFAALPMSLLESELFGYEAGAFTGAKRGGSRGLFEEAHSGTVFLDEIGDAPVEFQSSLLRVLQERQVRRVGGRKLIPIDVRFIAATNKNLLQEVKQGNFREDLYYRLSVLPIRMLSLRERKEDIPLLINFFIPRLSNGRFTRAEQIMTAETLEHLCNYDWPGNIRQLMNVVEFLLNIREDHHLIQIENLPEYFLNDVPNVDYSLTHEILGKDVVWLLQKIRDHGSIGRRYLTELAQRENVALTEGTIRGLLKTTESLGFTVSGAGRKGTILTQKGRQILKK